MCATEIKYGLIAKLLAKQPNKLDTIFGTSD